MENESHSIPVDIKEHLSANKIKLYRGYTTDKELRLSSDPNALNEIIDNNLDPHDAKFADKLLWVTTNRDFAEEVVFCRALIDMALDEDYKDDVLQGKIKLMVDEYEVNLDDGIYNVAKRKLTKPETTQDFASDQFIAENVEPTKSTSLGTNQLERMKRKLSSTSVDGQLRALDELEGLFGKIYMPRYKEMKSRKESLQFEEVIRDAHDFFVNEKGLSESDFRELVKESVFKTSAVPLKNKESSNGMMKKLSSLFTR